MKGGRKRWLVLAAAVSVYASLALSNHGVLYWLADTTWPPAPKTTEENHGVLRTVRCHYFTGSGSFRIDTSTGFGAETCGLLKRNPSEQ
jgi:hypothetical protein